MADAAELEPYFIATQQRTRTVRVCISRDSGQNCDGLFVVIAIWKYCQVLAGQTERRPIGASTCEPASMEGFQGLIPFSTLAAYRSYLLTSV